MNPFFTIGHSTRPLEAFAELLEQSQIRHLADVRTVPRSRTNPQFNGDTLGPSLAPWGITYHHIAELGGLRGKQRQVPASDNAFWHNSSFRNYADYTQTPPFEAGMEQLLDLGQSGRVVMMCAEAVWWRCHRRIIADHLLVRGFAVFHIMGPGQVVAASLTPGAVVTGGSTITYPAPPS